MEQKNTPHLPSPHPLTPTSPTSPPHPYPHQCLSLENRLIPPTTEASCPCLKETEAAPGRPSLLYLAHMSSVKALWCPAIPPCSDGSAAHSGSPYKPGLQHHRSLTKLVRGLALCSLRRWADDVFPCWDLPHCGWCLQNRPSPLSPLLPTHRVVGLVWGSHRTPRLRGTNCMSGWLPSHRYVFNEAGYSSSQATCLRGSETSQAAWGAAGLFTSGPFIPGPQWSQGRKRGLLFWRGILFQGEPGSPGPAF